MIQLRSAARVFALTVVTLVGVGACALDPQAAPDRDGGLSSVRATAETSGEGAASGSGEPTSVKSTPPTPTRKPTTKKTPKPATTAKSPAAPAGCPVGEHQREVERHLNTLGGFGRLTQDGRQSPADCVAIKKFQQRFDIRPAAGRAGPTTYDVAKRLATTDTRACKAGSTGTTFCVDLTRQTMWAMTSGKVVLGPTVTRTGMPGYRTPAGTFKVNFRNIKEWSDPYEVWLPYWQHFTQGMGFHQTTTYIHEKAIGSHGCVNLLPADAKRLWDLGKVGTRVVLVGRRPGT